MYRERRVTETMWSPYAGSVYEIRAGKNTYRRENPVKQKLSVP